MTSPATPKFLTFTLMSQPHIPQPCQQPWAAMTPTAAGRYCAACATEVVDFSAATSDEILHYLRHAARPVCGLLTAAQAPAPARPALLAPPAARPLPNWARWGRALAAGLSLPALLAHPALAANPVAAASFEVVASADATGRIRLTGQVFDGSSATPVAGARISLNDTNYGTETDEQGRFVLDMPADWPLLRTGKLTLHVSGSPFAFKPKIVTVAVRRQKKPLVVRLTSVPNRGNIMGKMAQPAPLQEPPK